MIKKFKKRFLLMTLVTLIAVIGTIVGSINVLNYLSVIKVSDETLELIMHNSGRFPHKPESFFPEFDLDITPETPYESRYFSVSFEGGKVVSVNTASIVAVDDEKAVAMAETIIKSTVKKGFWVNYRFLVETQGETTRVVFLDCTKSLNSANTFLLLSITICIFGILLVFLLLWILSNRILRPINDGYEKQKRFITDAGHDIKTPITIIDADAELLEMEIGENEWLSDIKKQTSRLASLTGDLIYLSRMQEMERTPHILFSISDVADDVVSSFAAPAKTKGITLRTNIAKNFSYRGDQDSIRKLFTLLLDNAIKYSPEGEIVSFSLKKQGRIAHIKIANIAPNLTDDVVTHMFDRFYRSDPSRSSAGGFGIGLSVAKAIVEAHKGRIFAKKLGSELVIEIFI